MLIVNGKVSKSIASLWFYLVLDLHNKLTYKFIEQINNVFFFYYMKT